MKLKEMIEEKSDILLNNKIILVPAIELSELYNILDNAVCEWSKDYENDGRVFYVGDCSFVSEHNIKIADYTYCPKCGKKIKEMK